MCQQTCCIKEGREYLQYTLLQKKRNFSEPIFPGDPGSLILTPGHVTKSICKMKYTTKFIYLHSSQRETKLSMLRFFWRRVYAILRLKQVAKYFLVSLEAKIFAPSGMSTYFWWALYIRYICMVKGYFGQSPRQLRTMLFVLRVSRKIQETWSGYREMNTSYLMKSISLSSSNGLSLCFIIAPHKAC